MPTYRTPDVYVEEISVFPPSVAEVETAVPAFIGYTETAAKVAAGDLKLKPTLIYSFKEYEDLFGLAKDDAITITVTDDGSGGYKVTSFSAGTTSAPAPSYLLYYAVKMFFDNGGGKCYIVSVGDYSTSIVLGGSSGTTGLVDGLNAVSLEDEPTLIVIPEAVKLGTADYTALVTAVLLQCGTLKDRFGIFDIRAGDTPLDAAAQLTNRGFFGSNNLKYGAAYYPFLKTTLKPYLKETDTQSNVQVTVVPASGGSGTASDLVKLKSGAPAVPAGTGTTPTPAVPAVPPNTTAYNFVKAALRDRFLVMPPSGAVAGVYAAVDTSRGVWKAPANVSLADVIEPVVKLDNARQDDLNVDATTGKSINALRAFAGKGTLVWGARTLAGNDNEWRYISVRRFFNMVEESVKKSTYWAVFEPNDANTWVKVRGMIENYLTQKWREGALAGATTKDAFFVRCGLGTTMSAQDILEGRMNVEIGMAVVRPAEFIILRFSHKLQTS